MDSISLTFKKLLGKGRAWLHPSGFTSELLDVFASPLVELKDRFINLKYIHFPTFLTDENNIANDEELFGIKDIANKTLSERAANIESQWTALSGVQNYKQIEQILQKKNLPVVVIENVPQATDILYPQAIGNGFLNIGGLIQDPVVIVDERGVFFVKAEEFLTDEQLKTIIDTVVKYKQGHFAVYYLPRFLRKKEIHGVMTKNQMQTYKKKQYCKVGV